MLPFVELKSVPQAPPGVAGIFDYHGQPVPVADLSQLALGRPSRQRFSTRILLIKIDLDDGRSALLGLVAERATQIIDKKPEDFVPSGVRSEAAPYLGDVASDERGLIQRLDVDKLLAGKARAALGDAVRLMPSYTCHSTRSKDVKRSMGLDVASIGRSSVEQAVSRRMAKSACTSLEDDLARVSSSTSELQELIEGLVVPGDVVQARPAGPRGHGAAGAGGERERRAAHACAEHPLRHGRGALQHRHRHRGSRPGSQWLPHRCRRHQRAEPLVPRHGSESTEPTRTGVRTRASRIGTSPSTPRATRSSTSSPSVGSSTGTCSAAQFASRPGLLRLHLLSQPSHLFRWTYEG